MFENVLCISNNTTSELDVQDTRVQVGARRERGQALPLVLVSTAHHPATDRQDALQRPTRALKTTLAGSLHHPQRPKTTAPPASLPVDTAHLAPSRRRPHTPPAQPSLPSVSPSTRSEPLETMSEAARADIASFVPVFLASSPGPRIQSPLLLPSPNPNQKNHTQKPCLPTPLRPPRLPPRLPPPLRRLPRPPTTPRLPLLLLLPPTTRTRPSLPRPSRTLLPPRKTRARRPPTRARRPRPRSTLASSTRPSPRPCSTRVRRECVPANCWRTY